MASIDLEYNSGFQIYNSDGTPFHDLVLHKCTYETVVMSLGDKISGILYYKDNALDVTMSEYIIYKGVRYTLVNPPTILKEGLVSDNSELKGMTKYSFTFYHPMYVLNNFSFNDVAVSSDQNKYLSQNKTFSWIGNLNDYVAKINKNLQGTEWIVKVGNNVTQEEKTKLSDVLSFDKNTIAEALKRGYETWEVPYVVDSIQKGEYFYINDKNQKIDYYDEDKHFVVQYGLPTTEITVEDDNGFKTPFVFKMGQGVGLKNNSRNPKNNKIITRIAGYGSEDNIPYGYPQIRYYGGTVQYPLYYGIVGGQRVQLIKHPFTRNHLMPSVYCQAVYNKVNPKLSDGSNNPNYNPNIELVDYYDADSTYANPIKSGSPSYEIHEFGDIKPELGEKTIISAVPVSQQETQSDYKQRSDFLQDILNRISATEIEDEKVCLKTLYDKVDAGLSYYAQKGEEGGREYWYRISVTSDDYYQYVSYESSNYNFTATVLRNGSSAPTPDWDDTMDDDGKYKQQYFKMTLPQLDFDLYACAAITQEMKINMRSGACIGCTFPVEVDWDDYKRNFYNSYGEFDPDGEQRDYTKYPNSSSGQITVMVKKELETFGTLMPNQYQQPTTGDKFVILGISLPESYITNAEQRLDADMKQYMRDNNVYYYEYPLKFDEHFLISNESILSQMKPNVVVRFEYAGVTHALYIKQMSVKYNESPLPKYDITLTDDIEIVLNQIGQVTDEVSKLRLGLGDGGGFGGNGQEYLRKDIDDTARGTIRMIKGMQVGERFVTGLLGEGGVFRKDSDGTTYLETDKLYVRMKAYFDTVEVKHYLHTGGNRIASQASGIVCSRVEMIDAYNNLTMDVADAVLFRCFFKANDGDKTIRNDFMIGDLAFCRETNVDVSSVNLHGYWRLVVGRNGNDSLTDNKEAWIDLSNRASETLTIGGRDYTCNGYQNGSDAPIAQDDIIQLGNIADKDRQGAIVEYVGGEDAPSYQIFQGIGEDLPYPYTLEDKNYVGLGYSSQTGHAYMNVYGDVFIGAKPDTVTGESPTYIKYAQEDPETGEPKLTIKAIVEFQSPDDPQTTTTLDDFALAVVGDISDLQNQIDGQIETWFYDGEPTLNNLPASQWPTTSEKKNHLGDLYYDNQTGYGYRFANTGTEQSPVFEWLRITDVDVVKALADAARAQDTADHKRRVFVAQPAPVSQNVYVEYDIGDLWVNATYPSGYSGETDEANHKYNNDYLRCIVAKPIRDAQGHVTDGTFSINDWQLASKYTDDTALLEFLDGYQGTLTTIRNQVDEKAETWYQDEDPSTLTPQQGGWYGGDDAEHVGDIWFCTKNHASPSMFKKGTTWIWQAHTTEQGVSYSWKEQEIPDEVFDKIDGKSSIYANDPNDVDSTKRHPSNYKANDVWILPMIYVNGVLNPSTYTINNITYGAGEMLTALRDNETYSAGDWAKKVRYTDDSALDNFKTNQYVQLLTGGQITSDINSARQTADNAQTAADAAQTSADNANTKLTDWASDSYISPTEKTALKTEWEDVKTEYTQICNDADKYSINKTAFTTAYTSANAAFQKYTAATPENITVGSDYQNIKDYYAARQTILNAISDAAKTLAQNAATAYMSDTALNAIKYALNGGSTTQDGGLILSNIIALRDANQNVMSGMNGVYNSQLTSGGIAAWYGGAMTDHEQSPSASNYAKSLFRFDGSGYLASGNITWTSEGQVTIRDLYTMISGEDSFQTNILNKATLFANLFHTSTQGTTVGTDTLIYPQAAFQYIDIKHPSGYTLTDYSVLNYGEMKSRFLTKEFFDSIFELYNNTTKIAVNGVLPADKSKLNIKAMFGFWTEKYISALGKNDGGGSSGGIDMTTVWSALAGSTTEQINATHLSNALSAYNPTSNFKTINGNSIIGTGNIVIQSSGGTVTSVKVGSTSYSPTDGVVSLPAYPTTLPASDVSAWAKASTKPTYTLDEVSDGSTRKLANYLPLSGGTMSNTNVVTNLNADLLDGLHLNRVVGTYTRAQIGTSPNYDNPSIQNGLFEMRVTSETTGETGTKPFDGFAPFLTFKVEVVMMQLAGSNATGWFIRGKQSANVTMKNTAWQQLARTTDNVASATKLQTARTIWGRSFDGTANVSGAISGATTISASSNVSVGGTLSVTGATTLSSTLGVTGAATLSSTLGVTGLLTASGGITIPSGKTLTIGDAVLSWDSTNQGIKITKGLYSQTFISALGQNSGGGGGIVLSEPLQSINNAGLGTPQSAGVGLVWNGSSWVYGTIGTGSGTVTSVKVGTTTYNPTNGVVSLPSYPTTLPASDVSAWAKASTKPSYTLDEVSDGSTRKLSDYTKTTAFKSLSIQGNGTSVGTYSPTSALTVNIAAGSNISITNDTTNHKITIANTYSYTLPNATTSAKGGVIIGNGLSVSDGKVSLGTSGVTAGTYRSVTVDKYGRVTNGTNPTTLAGYGITDAKIASGVITLGSNNITPVTSVGLSAPTGFSVTNTPVTKTGTLTLSYASGYEGFTTTLKNKINLLYSLFTREGSGTSSDPYVIKANYGLYSESFISALGQNSGSGGGGGVGDVTWDLLANNSDTRQIALSHLTTALSGYVTSVKVGTTAYSPSSGVVSLPAYPTKASWNYNDVYLKLSGGTVTGDINSKRNFDLSKSDNGISSTIYSTTFNILDSSSRISARLENVVKANGENGFFLYARQYDANGNIVKQEGLRYLLPKTGDGVWTIHNPSSFRTALGLGARATDNTDYLPLSGGTMSNTNVVTNLNADLLDGLHLNRVVGTYTRAQIGTSPNYDNPSIQNGLFEMRVTSETTGETGTKPFDGFAPFLTFKVEVVMMQLAGSNATGWFIRGKQSANVTMKNTAWQQLARTTDNVASATKLQTARTIWGRSFDGTANVSGNMTGVGTISASGDIGVTKSSGETNVFVSNNNGKIGLQTEKNRGLWDFTKSRWLIATNGTDSWLNAGNVGIGETSPSYKLDVNGDVHATNFRGNFVGNADSATKLQTARTIWGQNFNGTQNVSGSITNASGIKFNNTGTGFGYIDFHYASSSSLTSKIYESASGNLQINSVLNVKRGGNVGIGTTSPSQKLHVEGNIYANGRASINTTATSGILTVSRGSTSDYAIDVIGQQRYKDASGDTSDLSIGLFKSNKCPFIRFTDVLGGYFDVQMVPVVDSGGTVTDSLFSIGNTLHTSRVIARNFRVYTRISSDDSGNVQAMQALMNGRLLVGSADTTLVNGNTDCKFLVNGNMCTSAANGSFIKIGNVYLVYDSANNAIKVSASATGDAAANFYATGAISALGVGGSGSSGGGIDADWLKNNDVQIKRLGINVAPSEPYQLNVQGASNFTGSMTVNSSVTAVGGFSTSQGSISCAHDITAGGRGLIQERLTVGQSSLNNSYQLYVNGTSYFNDRVTMNNGCSCYGYLRLYNTSVSESHASFGLAKISGTEWVRLVGSDADFALYNDGDMWVTGYATLRGGYGSSDIRLKNIVNYVECKIDSIARAPIFDFTWKDKPQKGTHLGSSAQYWQNHFGSAITTSSDGYLAMDYGAVALASAVITARKVVDHELRIKQLEQENAILRKEIEELKAA